MRQEHQAADLMGLPLAGLLLALESGPDGLASGEAATRLARQGPNDLLAVRRRPLPLRFLDRFRNPLLVILLLASALSAVTGDPVSFAVVTLIVLLSIALDFLQEVHAENAVEALRRSVALRAVVRRDGADRELPVETLVPGDVIGLAAGNLVPADCRLLAARDLYAGPWQAFRWVTLPLLLPGIVAGFMLAFIVSLDDFIITNFVAGPGATTLPLAIYGMVRIGFTPEINAISTLLLLVSIVMVVLSYLVGRTRRAG